MKVLTPEDLPAAIQAVQGLRHLFEMVAAEYRDVEYQDVSHSYVLTLVDSLVLELQAVVAGSQSRALEPASDEEIRKDPTKADPRIDHLKTYTAALAYFAISNRLAPSSTVYLDLSDILSQYGYRKSQSAIRYWVENSHSHVTKTDVPMMMITRMRAELNRSQDFKYSNFLSEAKSGLRMPCRQAMEREAELARIVKRRKK
tara:strand:+ start:280 stop:882 length:603 start_codon:yes stop_codon:yes gene_type:complete